MIVFNLCSFIGVLFIVQFVLYVCYYTICVVLFVVFNLWFDW